jgi:hypothetical protein
MYRLSARLAHGDRYSLIHSILHSTPSTTAPYSPHLLSLHLLHQYPPSIVLSTIHHALRTTSHFLRAPPPTNKPHNNLHPHRIKIVQIWTVLPIIYTTTTILVSFVDSPSHSRTFLDLLETTFLMPQMVLSNECAFAFAGFLFETSGSSTRTIYRPLSLGSWLDTASGSWSERQY